MKFLLTLMFFSALLSGCQEESGNAPVDIEAGKGLKGVEIVSTSDNYDPAEGIYHLHATIKATGKQAFRNVRIRATYYDAIGREVAQSKAETDPVLNPGDKNAIETTCFFATSSDMPVKVVLTTEEQTSR